MNETFVKFVGPQPQKETLKLPVQKLDQQVKCGREKFEKKLIVLTSLHQVLLMLKLFVVLTVLHIQKKQLGMTVQRFLDRLKLEVPHSMLGPWVSVEVNWVLEVP